MLGNQFLDGVIFACFQCAQHSRNTIASRRNYRAQKKSRPTVVDEDFYRFALGQHIALAQFKDARGGFCRSVLGLGAPALRLVLFPQCDRFPQTLTSAASGTCSECGEMGFLRTM